MKAVFFDFDGVLTIDANDIITTCRYIAGRINAQHAQVIESYQKSIDDIWDFYKGEVPEETLWRSFHSNLQMDGLTDISYDKFRPMRKAAYESTELDQKMLNRATRVKESGYKVGIITDNCSERMRYLIKKYSLSDLFEIIVVSAEEKTSKHDQDMFNIALQRAGVDAKDSVFIDNNPNNLQVAKGLGISTILFDDKLRNYTALDRALQGYGVHLK